jgi:branched-chain amino acid transport system substrate-binding protein
MAKTKIWTWLVPLIVVIIILAIVIPLSMKKPAEEEVIKIGAILPLSGSGAYLGQQARDGIVIAQEEINGAGGIKGKQIKVIFEDSKGDPKEAVTVFNDLMMQENPQVMIVAFTAPTLALIPLAEEKKISLISTITSGPGIAAKGNYTFRIFTTSEIDAPIIANYVVDTLHLKKFGVIYMNDDYGLSYYESFKKTVENKGGEVVGAETFARSDADFKTQLLKLKEKNPEAIYVVGLDSHYITIFKQAKELNLNQILLGNWILASPNVIQKMGNTLEGSYFTTPLYYLETPQGKNAIFNAKYQEKFNKTADAYSAFGYDTLMIVAEAAKLKGASREGIYEGLLSVTYNGLLGNLSFDKDGEINFQLYPATIKNGKLVVISS